MENEDPNLTVPEAARYLGVSESSLSMMRQRKRGPAYIKPGPRTVRYAKSALDAYLTANTITPENAA